MNNQKTINIILGWSVFLVSALVYFITVEPTVSWWDCGEFIISAFKLEVGHPPGAPIHMLFGRIFSLLAPGTSKVALMVNLMSALASAGTIMLLYWSIVHLAGKVLPQEGRGRGEQLAIYGAGLTGALGFAFTDSFWFSAVEGEVYALSSLFTAAVFWAVLKWENEASKPFAGRWLVLIAYLVGLSIGVHLLNLLAIPAIALVVYFRKYEFSWKGFFSALFLSVLILGGIQYVLIPGLPAVAFLFDRIFVNSFGLPFNSGVLFMVALLAASLIWGIAYTRHRGMVIWNTAAVMLTVILIGYSSFALIVIRASANTPMNQNDPDNAYALKRYLNREQYGDRPLLYGEYYNAPVVGQSGTKSYYSKVDGKYVVTGTTADKTVYDPKMQTVFPRMYSSNASHIEIYREWSKSEGIPVRVNQQGQTTTIRRPSFADNLRFFVNYQLGHMYFRYFMWNFAGRQNDTQGHGNFLNGNWVSGINVLDESRIGPDHNMPGFMKDQPSNNTYYFLPLLFGLIGMFWQYQKGRSGREGFAVVLMLFVMTGIAIVVYLNQYPLQPRERDYAYTGSFYAFAIWMGLAVPALYDAVKKFLKGQAGAVAVTAFSLALVPGILLSQNFDDHDRSGRYMARDYAINYLESCAPNAILFTYGDNDTFPLWYVQEVEGVRPDIKIVNLSYLNMDWYINQQRTKTYEADPVPFPFEEENYYMGRMDIVLLQDRMKGSAELIDAMQFLKSDDQRTKVKVSNGEMLDFLPSRNFHITVDKNKVLETGTVQPEDSARIAERIEFSIPDRFLTKSELAVLGIVAANDWQRPVYIDHSLLHTGSVFFTEWLQFEGLAYRLVPIKTEAAAVTPGHVNTGVLYRNVMDKFVWGNVNDPDIFLDDYNVKEIKIIQARYMFARLAEALINEGQNEKAEKVLDRMFELFPNERIPLDYESLGAIVQYYRAGAVEKANAQANKLATNSLDLIRYYSTLPAYFARVTEGEQNREMTVVRNIMALASRNNQTALYQDIDNRLQQLIDHLSAENGS